GSTLAFWREKTFQTLALTVLVLVIWLALGEAVAHGAFGPSWRGISASDWAAVVSPWRAISQAARPVLASSSPLPYVGNSITGFLVLAVGLALLLNLTAIARVRVWNPSREVRPATEEAAEAESIWGLTEETAELRKQAAQ